jgi:Hypothetical methyltransferase
MAAIEMLERLEREEISYIKRRNLDVELSPEEKRERFIRIGDFTRLNNKINKQRTKITYEEMTEDPTIWEEYHREFREKKKTWSVIPVDEIIKTII